MSLKNQVLALNTFLTALHEREMRISTVIEELGFSEPEIRFIRENHLDEFVEFYLGLVRAGIAKVCGNNRLSLILTRRLGLDGNPPDTLASIGTRLGVSRERVRQLEAKALRKCRHRLNLQTWESETLRKVDALLAAAILPPPPAQPVETETRPWPPPGNPSTERPTGDEKRCSYSLERIRQVHPRAYEPWSPEEDEALWRRYNEKLSISQLAELFQRRPGAIRSRLRKLELRQAGPPITGGTPEREHRVEANPAREAAAPQAADHSQTLTPLQRAILQCVAAFPGRLSRTSVARILIASDSQRVAAYRADPLFGAFRHLSRGEVRQEVDFLIAAGLLRREGSLLFPAR